MEPFVVVFIFEILCAFFGLTALFTGCFTGDRGKETALQIGMMFIAICVACMASLIPVMFAGP